MRAFDQFLKPFSAFFRPDYPSQVNIETRLNQAAEGMVFKLILYSVPPQTIWRLYFKQILFRYKNGILIVENSHKWVFAVNVLQQGWRNRTMKLLFYNKRMCFLSPEEKYSAPTQHLGMCVRLLVLSLLTKFRMHQGTGLILKVTWTSQYFIIRQQFFLSPQMADPEMHQCCGNWNKAVEAGAARDGHYVKEGNTIGCQIRQT